MRVVIVGGGYAGVTCALRLAHRARRRGAGCEIVVINPADRFVERIRLHQALSGQRLPARDLRTLLARAGVSLVVAEAEGIDLAARTVSLGARTPERERTLHWDRMVLAMGSTVGTTQGAFGVDPATQRTLAARLRRLAPGGTVTVVGTGLTGIETATEIKEALPRLHVRLVGRRAVGAEWSPAARAHLLASLATLDVELLEGVDVYGRRDREVLTSAGPLDSDIAIGAAGFTWPALARQSGLAVAETGRICVDPQLRSISDAHVYAAGDVAAPVLEPGGPLPLGCKSAEPMGAFVGDNLARELAGEPPLPFDCAAPFFCVSLGRRNGLIQWASEAGDLNGRVLTGRAAAAMKEAVCKATWWALAMESRGIPAVVWKRSHQAPERLRADSFGALES